MTTWNKQIENRNFLSPIGFKFSLAKFPKVSYFCQTANIPSMNLSMQQQPTPFRSLPLEGFIDYDPLTLTFLVDENLENYREIHGWLTGLGFPRSHEQFETFINAGKDRFPTSNATAKNRDAGRTEDVGFDVGAQYSDATLTILSSKNNPVLEVRFRDLYPTSLSGLSYDQQAGDTSYLTGDVSFSYNIYEFATVGSATTTETTT